MVRSVLYMSRTVTATELGRNLADYLNRVMYRGESFVVQRGGRAIAELRPTAKGVRGADFLARYPSLPHLTPEEALVLEQDIERARGELAQVPVTSPWDS
jgi:antitoxin (DNA-binding transcriptional repressor) of toxin-antitoxin stability system